MQANIKVFKMKKGIRDVEDNTIIKICGTLRGTTARGFATTRLDGFVKSRVLEDERHEDEKESGKFGMQNHVDEVAALDEVLVEIKKLVIQKEVLRPYALSHAKAIRGKLVTLQLGIETRSQHPLSQVQFKPNDGENNLKRKQGPLEGKR